MGIGKSFKKAGKKLKKGANKATKSAKKAAKDATEKAEKAARDAKKAAEEAARDAADAAAKAAAKAAQEAADAAEAAAKAARAIEEAAEQAEREAARIGDRASKIADDAFDDALAAGEAAWNATVDALDQFFTDALAEVLLAAAMDVYRDSRDLIDLLARGGRAILADAEGAADLERVIVAAAGRTTSGAQKSLKALAQRPEMRAVAAEAGKFKTLSFGSGGSAAYGVGAEGCYGLAVVADDTSRTGGFNGVGGVALSVGAAPALQLAVWSPKPPDLAGPYFACTLEVEAGGGGGIQIVFPVPVTESEWLALVTGQKIPRPCGIVVFLGGGAELSASVSGGYTWVF